MVLYGIGVSLRKTIQQRSDILLEHHTRKWTFILFIVTLLALNEHFHLSTVYLHFSSLSPGETDDGNAAIFGNRAVSGETDTSILQESFLVGLGQPFQLLL